jgi:hypothetical protein
MEYIMSTEYNYLESVKEDVLEYIKNEIDFSEFDTIEELGEKLNDTLFTEDSVTGNASGSYTFNTYEAEENISHNWDLLAEAMEEFGSTENPIDKGAEWCDVTIRCYLLGQAISEALEEIEEEFNEAHEDDEEEETEE